MDEGWIEGQMGIASMGGQLMALLQVECGGLTGSDDVSFRVFMPRWDATGRWKSPHGDSLSYHVRLFSEQVRSDEESGVGPFHPSPDSSPSAEGSA